MAGFIIILLGVVIFLYHQLKRSQRKFTREIKTRDMFSGMAAHEIKGPLTSIKIYAQLLARKYDDRSAQMMSHEVERIVKMVDNLFYYSKLAQGNYPVTNELVDLKQLLLDRISSFKLVYPSRKINLQCPYKKAELLTDRLAVEQIVTNILTNAIRYADGEITIKISYQANFYQMLFTDHGNGIPLKIQKVIWEAFSKPSIQGLGLGLYIVKQLVAAIGGRISFKSSDEGTTFLIELPKIKERRIDS